MKSNVLCLICLTILVGCSMSSNGSTFDKEPFVDAKRDAHGNVILRDTPRMWANFTEEVDLRVKSEMHGGRPPGVAKWNDHWTDQIKTMEKGGQENAQKYIAYIIEARRKAGLPELEGY
ncbi:hypothetical protein J2X04_000177 [Lysobacter niabensis]|uniref:Lipoprotein n=1 Tax=Agrilutibacter niabensis TaxID=380628 RepID=A0ABU1VKG9_9GAMM|nr:hypothetical protein [Lysobacter niabensis]MDR7097830.1 hypothetical protein [Lysobacter niabensis]